MQLQHIDLADLKTAAVNVRKHGGREVGDLVSSIRSLGVLQPLLVRPNCEGYEIVAGQRRYRALLKLAEEGCVEPVPCIVMQDGDDARAIEASLAENTARLPMDEIDQYKAFAALVKEGAEPEEIAGRFGVTARLVRQRLAIANIIPPILTAYRRDDIRPETLRILTMASRSQQKAWLELFRSEDEHVPEGHALKRWLFGGADIPTGNALFDPAAYPGAIVTDLFGKDSYFDSAERFWTLQNTAIAEARERYLADGWADVVVLEVGAHFPAYEFTEVAKEKGGRVYVEIARDGEVTVFEGRLPRKEVRAAQRDKETGPRTVTSRPELTKAMQNYLDLHRHSAVRTALLDDRGMALRLATAQMVAGSALWQVRAEPRKADSVAIGESLAANGAEERFGGERAAVCALLGIEIETGATLVPGKDAWGAERDLHGLFARLLALSDEEVMRVLTFAVAETLPCGTAMTEALGLLLRVDMGACWQPDDTFFALLRDKRAINGMVAEIAGKPVADGNIAATAKVQKRIVQSCLNGTRTAVVDGWLPRYMAFPMQAYTEESGIRTIEDWQEASGHYA